jgi:hypothetical protein
MVMFSEGQNKLEYLHKQPAKILGSDFAQNDKDENAHLARRQKLVVTNRQLSF